MPHLDYHSRLHIAQVIREPRTVAVHSHKQHHPQREMIDARHIDDWQIILVYSILGCRKAKQVL